MWASTGWGCRGKGKETQPSPPPPPQQELTWGSFPGPGNHHQSRKPRRMLNQLGHWGVPQISFFQEEVTFRKDIKRERGEKQQRELKQAGWGRDAALDGEKREGKDKKMSLLTGLILPYRVAVTQKGQKELLKIAAGHPAPSVDCNFSTP